MILYWDSLIALDNVYLADYDVNSSHPSCVDKGANKPDAEGMATKAISPGHL
jgi:hypothetical protein